MIDNNDKNSNSDSSGSGAKSRFRERLKKIRSDRRKLRNNINTEAANVNKYDARRLAKPFLIITSLFLNPIKSENKKQKNNVFVSKKNNIDNVKVNDIAYNSMIQNEVSNQTNILYTENKNINNVVDNVINTDKKIHDLQKEVIDLIKKRLIKNMNELEMIQSELYILKEITGNNIFVEECQEDIKEVKKLLSKIKTLKERYNYLKENTNFDDLLEIGEDVLIDKILELKDMCTSEDVKTTVENYKILEEYKYLYLKIDKLEENIIKFNDYKLKQEEELKKRDFDFDKLKNDFYIKQKEQENYDNFVKEQEFLLKSIDEKLLTIDSHEVINYKLKGFNQLVANSFKYLGLLLASPLKGLLPGIAAETVATKNIVHNLYNNLEWEAERKIVYEAIDFSLSLNAFKNDLDKTLNLVDVTLEDIARLKDKYKKDLSKYEYDIAEYSEIFKKINKMENAVLNNRIKIQLMKEKTLEKEKQNEEKMKRVKKLNCSANN